MEFFTIYFLPRVLEKQKLYSYNGFKGKFVCDFEVMTTNWTFSQIDDDLEEMKQSTMLEF